jgi:hypothetical protein
MSATTIPTPSPKVVASAAQVDDVIDAMRSINSEADRWHLADALLVTNPSGTNDFATIVEKATAAGVLGQLSANTLRLYRDTASHWPVSRRIVGVSFSAHREVEKLHTIDAAVKMLENCVKAAGGPDKVTIKAVRQAVAISQGKAVTPAPAAAPVAASQSVMDALDDLRQGGKKLIQSIPRTTPSSQLDEYHAGLSKVLAHVEALRSKASQKAAAAKKGASPAAPAAPAPAPAKAEASQPVADNGEATPDLRDLA